MDMKGQSIAERPAILVVDDEEAILRAVERILKPEYSVTSTTSPHEALKLLDDGASYVTVVCDLSMPEMSGLDLLRSVQERDAGTPVIILTGQATLETAVRVIEHGGFRYLTKPFEEQALLDAVRAASARRKIEVLRRRAVEKFDSGSFAAHVDGDLERYFDDALENLFMVFQPIVEGTTGDTYGFEALVRSRSAQLGNPALLLGTAERLGRVREVGREVRRLVAKQLEFAPPEAKMFVNVHALDLGDEELYASTAPLSRVAERVVLEVTERMSLDTVANPLDLIQRLRDLGYGIAVDDLGAGYAGLTSFSELRPDVVKLDMSLIRGLDQDARKRSIVGSLLTVCIRDLETRVVCEGVETMAEYSALAALGVDLLQGYLFGRPAPEFEAARRLSSQE